MKIDNPYTTIVTAQVDRKNGQEIGEKGSASDHVYSIRAALYTYEH